MERTSKEKTITTKTVGAMLAKTIEEISSKSSRKSTFTTTFAIIFNLQIDLKFWTIIPTIHLNFHTRNLEFEFLCLGIYISVKG